MTGQRQSDSAYELPEELSDAPQPFIRVDQRGVVIAANVAAQPILEEWGSSVGGSIPENVTAACATTLSSGEAISFVIHAGALDFDLRVQRSRDEQALLFFGQNITERLQAEHQMEVLARIPEEDPNPVFRAAHDGRIEYRNEAASDLLSALALPVDRVPREWAEHLNAVASGTAAQAEMEVSVARRTWLLSFTSVEFAEYAYIHGRDMTDWNRVQTELKTARDRAEAANRTKSTFLANMSHELRTPLNAIIGYSELLMEEVEDFDDAQQLRQDLQRIRMSGGHLLGLIGEILDLSKIEAGKMSLFLEQFQLREIIDQARASVEPMIIQNGNRLSLAELPELGMWESDGAKIRQILLNLLSNAAKFTEDGEVSLSVTVGQQAPESISSDEVPRSRLVSEGSDSTIVAPDTQTNSQWVTFEVRDSGIGMAPETLAKLFRPFVQADDSSTRVHGGTGLGLAISRHFARMLGGEIFAESAVGKGSTFSLVLPSRIVVG